MALNLKSTRLTPAQLAKKEKERKLLEQAARKTNERRTAIKTGDDIALKNVKPVGENLFLTNVLPIKQNDNLAVKVGKGTVNAGLSVLSAPGEALRHVSLLASGKTDIPKNTSFTEDILPTSVSDSINKLAEKRPILGGLAKMGLDTVADPTTYITGGTAKTLLTPQELGLGKLAKPKPKVEAENPKAEVVDEADDFFDLEGEQGIDFTADQFGNVRRGEAQEALPAGRQPLMLQAGRTPKALSGRQPLMLPEGKIPNWETPTPYQTDLALGKLAKGNAPLDILPAQENGLFINQKELNKFLRNRNQQIIKSQKQNMDPFAGMRELNEVPMVTADASRTPELLTAKISKAIEEATQRLNTRNAAYKPGNMNAVARNPLEDIRDLTIIGAGKIAKGSIEFAQWSKEMIDEFGQIIEKQLPGIWKHANILNDTGETTLKYKGQVMPVKWQVTQAAKTSERATVNRISQVETKKPSTSVGDGNAVKSIPEGEVERGFSRNTRTDANNPDNLRDSLTEKPLTYEQLANKETLGKAQTIFDLGHEPARSELNKLLDEMKPEAIPLAKLLSRQASEAGNMEAAREIIANTAEKLTQAGQFGQAARILREADPETFMLTMEKQLKSLNKEGKNVYGEKWKDIDLTPDELDMIGNIKRGDQQSYEDVFEQIHKRIANELPATVMEKVNAWRHISMLLNPKTQVRNVVGNGIMMGMRQGAKQISAALQKVILPAEKRTQVWKVDPEYKEIASSYFEANKKDLLSGANKYNEGIRLNMPDKRVFRNDALESTRQFTYKLLEKGDTPFYKRAYINRLASFAQARGIKNLADLPQEAFDTAKLEAEQATYKDASELASYLNRVKHPGANANLGQKSVAVIAEAALPFTKTPINIVKRGIQYSPAGIINGISKWGKESAAAGIDEMAKGLTGTGVLGLGYLLAQNEILTGKPAEDADLKSYNANSGNAPFSILGKYTYDWAMPFAVPLSIGVELYNAVKDTEDEAKLNHVVSGGNTDKLAEIAQLSSDIIYNSLAAAGDTTFNMSLMKSIKNLFSNPKGFTAGLAQLPQNYVSQFVPTILGQTAGMIDPTVRQSYEKGNIPASILANIETKTPGLSFLAEPKQTPFGEDMKRVQNPLGRLAAQYVSPGNISVDQNIDPQINEEINRLGKLGFKNHIPTVVPNYIEKTSKYPKLELTADETTQYQKRTGELTLSGMKELIDSNEYKFKEDEEQAEMLAKVIKEAKAQAKAEIVEAKGYEPIGTGKKQSGSGLMSFINR